MVDVLTRRRQRQTEASDADRTAISSRLARSRAHPDRVRRSLAGDSPIKKPVPRLHKTTLRRDSAIPLAVPTSQTKVQ